jgi:predicted DNA-binding transcriptional regulator YafY
MQSDLTRLSRLTSILTMLMSKSTLTAQDIADKFGISVRTVYRDIRALEDSGVPIIGEPGNGYSLMDGYKLPPIMFTREEASSIITAEKLLEKLADTKTYQDFSSASAKIKSLLKTFDKYHLEGIEDNIMVIKNPYVPVEEGRFDQIPEILNSITRQKVLQMEYFTAHSQETKERDVEPVGIFYSLGQWYMIAYCHLRQAYRNFRIDRIQKVSISQKVFSHDHPSLSQYLEEVSRDQRELTKVVIRVDKEALRFLGEQKYYQGFVSEIDLGDEVEMTFLSCSLSGFARWVLWFADQVTIIEPVELTEEVRRYLKPLISKFGVNM